MKATRIFLGLATAFILLTGGFAAKTLLVQAAAAPQAQLAPSTILLRQKNQPGAVATRQPSPAITGVRIVTPPVPAPIGPQDVQPVAPDRPYFQQNHPLMGMMPYHGQMMQGWGMSGYPQQWRPGMMQGWGMSGYPQQWGPGMMQNWGGGGCDNQWNRAGSNNHQQWGSGMMHNGMVGGDCWGLQREPTSKNQQAVPATPTGTTPAVISFKGEVQPILAARCVACHGGTSGLYLDSYENILKGGNNGAVVVPGDVTRSRLAYFVHSGYMPYRSAPLSAAEIQSILGWIASGAPNN